MKRKQNAYAGNDPVNMVDESGLLYQLNDAGLSSAVAYNEQNFLNYSNPVGFNTVLSPQVNQQIALNNYLDNYNGDYLAGKYTDAAASTVTGFGDGVFWAITLGHGFGYGVGLNEIREIVWDTGVNTEVTSYKVGYYTGAVEGSLALSGATAVKYAGFRGPEYGRWKDSGVWQEGWHFHLGKGNNGLNKHHLPQQSSNWWKNFKAVVKRKWDKK